MLIIALQTKQKQKQKQKKKKTNRENHKMIHKNDGFCMSKFHGMWKII